jgi:hypothetical protein
MNVTNAVERRYTGSIASTLSIRWKPPGSWPLKAERMAPASAKSSTETPVLLA